MGDEERDRRKTPVDRLSGNIGNSWREVYRTMGCNPDAHEDTEEGYDG